MWINSVYELVANEKTADALDVLFDNIDDLLLSGEFEECDRILISFDLDKLNASLLLGLLTITFMAKDKLKERKNLYSKIEDKLNIICPNTSERKLWGLR